MFRRLGFSLALAALLAPGLSAGLQPSQAPRATVLLRNGERMSGVLEDIENGTLYLRVSLHDQRRHALGEVAVVDFAGGATDLPEEEVRLARGADHLAVLKDGTKATGQFVDLRGGEASAAPGQPFALHFRVAGEERRVPVDTVSRIYFGQFPGQATQIDEVGRPLPAPTDRPRRSPTGDLPPQDAVLVPGNAAWVATPLFVRRGDRVSFEVTGRIQLSSDPDDVAVPAGSLRRRHAAGSPLPANFAGALIGRIGDSDPFPIGNTTRPIAMPATGQLFFGINDDQLGDNRGEFVVTMLQTRRR